MSVFGLLKNKILSLKEDIQTSSKDKPAEEWSARGPPGVTAGGDLLLHFQKQWELLRQNSQAVSADCKDVQCLLLSATLRVQQAHDQLSSLHAQLAELPALIAGVEQTCSLVGSLQEQCEEVQSALEVLEDAVEEEEHRAAQGQLKKKLLRRKAEHTTHLESLRESLEASLAAKRQQVLDEASRVQRERQAVFDEAFRTDLQLYEQRGHLDKLPIAEAASKLEDIDLDSDQTGLDEFLGDVEATDEVSDVTDEESESGTNGKSGKVEEAVAKGGKSAKIDELHDGMQETVLGQAARTESDTEKEVKSAKLDESQDETQKNALNQAAKTESEISKDQE